VKFGQFGPNPRTMAKTNAVDAVVPPSEIEGHDDTPREGGGKQGTYNPNVMVRAFVHLDAPCWICGSS
jgi:hypothetical protein